MIIDDYKQYMTDNTQEAFQRLTDLFGEANLVGDPKETMKIWNETLGQYALNDILEACNKLYRYGKLKTFPRLAHLESYLLGYEKIQSLNTDKVDDNNNVRPEYRGIIKEASLFSTLCNLWASSKCMEEANKLNHKMCMYAIKNKEKLSNDQYQFFLWGVGRKAIIQDEFDKNKKSQFKKYDNDYLNFLEQYKLGFFDKYLNIINKFKEQLV